jgi:hypothetical protein
VGVQVPLAAPFINFFSLSLGLLFLALLHVLLDFLDATSDIAGFTTSAVVRRYLPTRKVTQGSLVCLGAQ